MMSERCFITSVAFEGGLNSNTAKAPSQRIWFEFVKKDGTRRWKHPEDEETMKWKVGEYEKVNVYSVGAVPTLRCKTVNGEIDVKVRQCGYQFVATIDLTGITRISLQTDLWLDEHIENQSCWRGKYAEPESEESDGKESETDLEDWEGE